MATTDATVRNVHERVCARLRALGLPNNLIPLACVIDAWPSNPTGFHFTYLDAARRAVEANFHFAREHALFERVEGIVAPDCAFREAGHDESVHFIFRMRGNAPCVVHVDSISIVEARDSRTGRAIYRDDLGTLIEHVRVDLDHRSCMWRCR